MPYQRPLHHWSLPASVDILRALIDTDTNAQVLLRQLDSLLPDLAVTAPKFNAAPHHQGIVERLNAYYTKRRSDIKAVPSRLLSALLSAVLIGIGFLAPPSVVVLLLLAIVAYVLSQVNTN